MSLLPVCGKTFERLIFISFYKYLEDKKLLSVHRSGFLLSDSCVNQLLSIVHKLYKAFDAYPTLETSGVFLDMSKAFDKVWHEGLIFNLSQLGFPILCYVLLKVSYVIDSRECYEMARRLNGYQLRLACHKAPSLDYFFSLFTLMTFRQFIINSKTLFR